MKASDINIATAYPESEGMSAAHRDPNEAGEADRYYGRNPKPNFAYRGTTFLAEEMTPEQIDAYWRGFHGGLNKAKAWRKA
jgi:hypothetical protein